MPGSCGNAETFVRALREAGHDVYTGVPCSFLKGAIACLGEAFLVGTREDGAIGLAVWAWLAGRRPVVFMQNSGLGTSLNALSSLVLLYRIPILLVISWRGHEGAGDLVEHLLDGRMTVPLLDGLGLPHREVDPMDTAASVRWARDRLVNEGSPVALLVRKGILG